MTNTAINIFWSDEDGGWIAVDANRPGCCAFGTTAEGAALELSDAQFAWDSARANADKRNAG